MCLRIRLLSEGMLLAALAWPACALAADHAVTLGGAAGNVFTPASVTVQVGDTVTFSNAGGFHNVASDNQSAAWSFRCSDNCSSSSSPSGSGWTAVITVTAAMPASLGFHCDAHQASGMSGTLNITTPVELQSYSVE